MILQSYRFDRSERLLKSADFQNVFDKPYRVSDSYFTILVKKTGLHKPRLGLAISKKHARRAVDRNRIKRLVRESFRSHKALLPGIDIVVLAKSETYRATNPVLQNSLLDLWKSVHRKFSLTENS